MFTVNVNYMGKAVRLTWVDHGAIIGDPLARTRLHSITKHYAAQMPGHSALLSHPVTAYLLMGLAFGPVEIVDGELPPLPCLPECCPH